MPMSLFMTSFTLWGMAFAAAPSLEPGIGFAGADGLPGPAEATPLALPSPLALMLGSGMGSPVMPGTVLKNHSDLLPVQKGDGQVRSGLRSETRA